MLRSAPEVRALLRSAAIRQIESAALAETAAGELMSRAAQAVALAAERHLRQRLAGCPVIAFCGPGNNGGDALLAALLLHQRGYDARAFELAGAALRPRASSASAVNPRSETRTDGLWVGEDKCGGARNAVPPSDALRVRTRAAAANLEPLRIESSQALRALLAQLADPPGRTPLVIDGLFGIGLTRPLAGLPAELCRLLAEFRMPVIAIDVPSGIDADRGAIVGGPGGSAIRAIETVTMIADKPGLHTGPARDFVGRTTLARLGLPAQSEAMDSGELFGRDAAALLLPARRPDSSKGSYGSVLVIGGASGMHGAALLAALGAQHGGAGKVWIAAPGQRVFDPGQPQLMSRDADEGFDVADVLVAGCGLGTDARSAALLARVLASPLPAVLDADALNLLAGKGAGSALGASPENRAERVLTPHPLEAARLLNCTAAEVQADRVASARTLARERNAIVALKGAGTVIAAPDGRWAIIDAGGPALATAGTGDVLAGLIGALIAQGLAPWEASLLACWSHGDGADRWTRAQGRGAGLSAAELPVLIRQSLACLA